MDPNSSEEITHPISQNPISHRREIEAQLKSLPESFSTDEIRAMFNSLLKDVDIEGKKKHPLPRSELEKMLHSKHRTLAYSYPTLFFRTVRGEMNLHIFEKIMQIKKSVDDGSITKEDAKKAVIDGAKAHVEGAGPRVTRISSPGEITQEITRIVKIED